MREVCVHGYGLRVEEVPGLAARLGPPETIHLSGLLDLVRRVILIDAEEAARAPGRRRFSIAHELGHWVLHGKDASAETFWCEDWNVDSGPPGEASRPLADPVRELEANAFAAAVLMPTELLLSQDRPRGEDEEYRLAGLLGVSREALLRRYQTLDHWGES